MRACVALILSLVGTPGFASALATVSAVQPPAWIETNGHKHALAAGQVIVAGDHLTTGAGGRAHIELAEDSIVKLGENADFVVRLLSQASAPNGDAPLFK